MRTTTLLLAVALLVAPSFAFAGEDHGHVDCATKCKNSKEADCMKKCEADHSHDGHGH